LEECAQEKRQLCQVRGDCRKMPSIQRVLSPQLPLLKHPPPNLGELTMFFNM
jgi:hypothetical protein